MQLSTRKIEQSLKKKGFVREDGDHKYFYHEYQGKRTGIYTKLSFGSQYKDYGDDLVNLMKKQLSLDNNRQTVDFLNCPMKKEKYEEILKKKGRL